MNFRGTAEEVKKVDDSPGRVRSSLCGFKRLRLWMVEPPSDSLCPRFGSQIWTTSAALTPRRLENRLWPTESNRKQRTNPTPSDTNPIHQTSTLSPSSVPSETSGNQTPSGVSLSQVRAQGASPWHLAAKMKVRRPNQKTCGRGPEA